MGVLNIAKMSRTGKNFQLRAGNLLLNQPEAAWRKALVELPWDKQRSGANLIQSFRDVQSLNCPATTNKSVNRCRPDKVRYPANQGRGRRDEARGQPALDSRFDLLLHAL